MRRLSLLPVLFALCAPTSAQEVFVDSTRGNDNNPGTAALPVRSVTRGIALATNGSTVSVYPGIYGPSQTGEVLPISIGMSLQHANLLLRALGPVLIDLGGGTATCLRIGGNAPGARVTGFAFSNSDRTGWWTRVIELETGATNVKIDRCRFDQVNRGIVIWERSPDVTGCRVHHNLFTSLGNDAINDFEMQGANLLDHNTIVGRTTGLNYVGILVESPAVRVINNLVVGMRDGFTAGVGAVGTSFRHNNAWQCTNAFAGSITTPPPTNTAVDPQLVNQGGGDFRLQPGSPLIDGGDPQVPMAADPDRNPVPVDFDRNGTLLPDVGAYERSLAQATYSYNRTTGQIAITLTTGITTPTLGALFFSLDEAVVPLTGVGPLLLDLALLMPYTTPASIPPINLQTVLPPIPPGIALVMQGALLDPSRTQLVLSNAARLQW